MSIPKTGTRPQVTFIIHVNHESEATGKDIGHQMLKFEWKGMLNGGYIVRGTFADPNFNMLNTLVDSGYFLESRVRPVMVTFQMRWDSPTKTQYPESATRTQKAFLLSLKHTGKSGDVAHLEFVAIDPASWLLNKGNANGGVYKGRISEVIKKVVGEYAPQIKLDISATVDSDLGKWYMMRQDPKTFISSLFDWSSSVTRKKTQWVFVPDGMNLIIKEQADIPSVQRAYYKYQSEDKEDTIVDWEFVADNALSAVENKLVTHGISAVSGQYLDRVVDNEERYVFVKDDNTRNKKVAKISKLQGFSKPADDKAQNSGWTAIAAIPEVYSGGEMGLDYREYIDGRPRTMWLNMTNALMRVRLRCVGHGEWSGCHGLGSDTIFIKWSADPPAKGEHRPYWWMSGNWLVYGFNHRMTRGSWETDLYIARFDHDSTAVKVSK